MGDRGNIEIQTALLFLRGASGISTNAEENASGGNILINADDGFLIAAPQGDNDITANAVFGEGGRVNIDALEIIGIEPRLQLTPLSDITASSEFGIAGSVVLGDQDLNVERSLPKLPNNFIAPNLIQGCRREVNTPSSRFVNLGQGGLRPQPTELLESDDFIDDIETPEQLSNLETTLINPDSVSNQEIVEAQGWIVNQEGKVELVMDHQSSTLSQLPCEL